MQSPTLVDGGMDGINPEGVEWFAWVRRVRVMQPRWGWELFWRMTQGSPTLRATPGLNDGIPLGFPETQLLPRRFLAMRGIS